MTSLRTIDVEKLEAEIEKRRAAMAAISRGRKSLPLDDGVQHERLHAEFNALVAVYDSLR